MPFWANAPKTLSETITSADNLQKLGNSKIMEDGSRIDFSEAKYFQGEEQDSFVFAPTNWTNVKGTNGYNPTLSPSLIHFTRKEHKGFKGVTKELTPKDKFFSEQLSKRMESGKVYFGFIDTGIPQNAIDAINDPANAANAELLIGMYLNVTEVETPSSVLQSLVITESRSSGGYGGYGGGKGESEADKIQSRIKAIEATALKIKGLTTTEQGEIDKAVLSCLDRVDFAVLVSLQLGLPIPSNLSHWVD